MVIVLSKSMDRRKMNDFLFWEQRYQRQQTPWNICQPAPPLVSFYQQNASMMPVGNMIVVGCGHGHDAAYFASQGFDVTGLDFVPEALLQAEASYGQQVKWVEGNLFQLPDHLIHQFDYVVEHTCFCAIHPEDRQKYVQAASSLLKPNGHVLGLFWAFVDPDGPPWPSHEDELKSLFGQHFQIEKLYRPQNSIQSRLNQEILGYFKK
jgi:methyl halide transferase